MNETKHTPGPWQTLYKHKYDEWHVTVPASNSNLMRITLFDDGVPGDTPEEREGNARLIAAAPDLLDACEALWSELKNKLASIEVHPGFPFEDDSPCTVYFLDRIAHCDTMTEGIAKCDELMIEEFPEVYAAIAAAKGGDTAKT